VLALVAGAGALAAAGVISYGAVSPSSQLFGRTFVAAGAASRQLALTFDDGPNDPHTLRLLEVLARHGVKATFFMIGRFVRERPEIARAVAQAGHVVGNHTYTHPNLFFASGSRLARELDDCEKALTEVVGEHSKLFRPPFGLRRPGTLRAATYGHMNFQLTRTATGEPVRELQTYLGSFGHMLIMSEDMVEHVHAHPVAMLPEGFDPEELKGGPDVLFEGLMPKAGRYRAWTQFRYQDKLHTFVNTFEVFDVGQRAASP